jgi:hypothetical protein
VPILNQRNAGTGEPDETETLLSGSGRGGEKRLGNETSLAAYFIALGLEGQGAYARDAKLLVSG